MYPQPRHRGGWRRPPPLVVSHTNAAGQRRPIPHRSLDDYQWLESACPDLVCVVSQPVESDGSRCLRLRSVFPRSSGNSSSPRHQWSAARAGLRLSSPGTGYSAPRALRDIFLRFCFKTLKKKKESFSLEGEARAFLRRFQLEPLQTAASGSEQTGVFT